MTTSISGPILSIGTSTCRASKPSSTGLFDHGLARFIVSTVA
jgi:hypothetical protein